MGYKGKLDHRSSKAPGRESVGSSDGSLWDRRGNVGWWGWRGEGDRLYLTAQRPPPTTWASRSAQAWVHSSASRRTQPYTCPSLHHNDQDTLSSVCVCVCVLACARCVCMCVCVSEKSEVQWKDLLFSFPLLLHKDRESRGSRCVCKSS